MRSVIAPLAPVIALALIASIARAQDAGAPDPRALVERATAAERDADPAAAERAWSEVIEVAPTSRYAARARRRLDFLHARSEGGYAPLATLMRFQQTPIGARDRGAVEDLERAIDAMPEGRVRVESLQAAAAEWRRLREPERATADYRRLLADRAAGEADRAVAEDGLARALHDAGRAEDALRELESSGLRGSAADVAMRAERRRRVLAPVSWIVIAAFALLAVALAAPALRRAPARALRVAFPASRAIAIAWVALVPWAIATLYDHEASDTFALLALGTVAVLGVASIGTAGASTPRRRAALAAGVVLAELGVGYLVADRAAGLLSFLS